jgi:hypothetical protein
VEVNRRYTSFTTSKANRVACTCNPLQLPALLPIELGKTRLLLLPTVPARRKNGSPIVRAQGQNRALQTVSPIITVPELLPRCLVSNAVLEAGRVLSRIVSQRRPVVAHVHLTAPGSVIAECVQRRVVSVAHDKLQAKRSISPTLRNECGIVGVCLPAESSRSNAERD